MSEYKKDELGTAAIKRVVELEAKNGELDKKLEAVEMVHSNYVNVSCDLYSTLEKKLEIACEALEFYADRMSYSLDDYNGISGEMRSRVILYGDSIEVNDVSSRAGRRATEALTAINGEGV